MSAVPLHRSATKDRFEESKTDGYSESIDIDKHYQKDLEYDVELRKQALMSIVTHIKNPQRRGSIFSDSDRSIGDCTFFEEEKQKYQSAQRREIKRPIRRAFSFTELKPIDEADEFDLSSEEDTSENDKDKTHVARHPPIIQRRMSFPMRAEELEEVENPIFFEAIDEYRNKLLLQQADNVYADSRPPKAVVISTPPVMCEMTTQTMLRDIIFEEHSDEELRGAEYEEAELESNFAGQLIEGVIDNLSESSEFRQTHKLDADRLRDIPEFELEDILGLFDVDENGNFIFKTHNGINSDNNNRRVNKKGYLVDIHSNIINKKGDIIFYEHELSSDGEIPAPFVYEKHKTDFLNKAMKRKEGLLIDPNYMMEDDEDLVEAELEKMRPNSKESSVESLIADNPGMYVDENLTKGKKSINNSPNRLDAEMANQSKLDQTSPSRKEITENDINLAKAYGGKAKGGLSQTFKGQPQRITKDKTKKLFPSLLVEDQAKAKLSKIADKLHQTDSVSNMSKSKMEKNEELRRRLEKLKQQHYNDVELLNDLGDLNMDLIDEKLNEFDYNRQMEYERRMQANIANNVFPYNRPPAQTSSNFFPQRPPFQSSDLLPSNADSRITTSKNNLNRFDSRPKTKQISGLRKIYGNLGELVVPAEKRDYEKASRLQSPGSTMSLRTGLSRQPTQSKFESNSRIRGLEMIYLQKLENKSKKSNQNKKAKFRTLLNRYVDDPSVLLDDEINLAPNPQQNHSRMLDNSRVSKFDNSQMELVD